MALLFRSRPALTAHCPTRCREVLPLSVAPHRTGQFVRKPGRFCVIFTQSAWLHRASIPDSEIPKFIHPASLPEIGAAFV